MPFPTPNMGAPQTPQQGSWGGDFSGQLNDMLAPYKQMSQQFQSPYATMRPQGWLQDNHPQLAHTLDNAFLTMGMTPESQGPEGAGGGISRAMQGLIGGQQFNRQRMMQQAMMPYQMMQPALQSMDTLSQMNERNAMVPFRIAQEKYMQSRDENYQSLIAGREQSKALAGEMVDDKGQTWNRIFDPKAGRVSLVHGVTGQDANDLPEGQRPTFANSEKTARRSAPGGLLGEIMDMQANPDPAVKAEGSRRYSEYVQAQGAIAGARTGASQDITQPVKDLKTFVGQERNAAYGQMEKVPSATDFQTKSMLDANYWKDPQKAYENEVKRIQGTKQQLDVDLSKYEKSAAPRQGVSFSEYKQNPSIYDGSAPAPPQSTSGTGSNWTPK